MKKPEFTCPKKEDLEETLKEFQDTSVAFTEIDTCIEKLKASYKLQYDYYIDEIMCKLNTYKESCENLREYCEYLETIDQERTHSMKKALEAIKNIDSLSQIKDILSKSLERNSEEPIKTKKGTLMQLLEVVQFYANHKNWNTPDVDSRGFSGMSARSIIELEDYDSKLFSSGKLAREILERKEVKQYLGNA